MNPIILSILNLIRGQSGEVLPFSDFDPSLILDKITELQNSIGTISSGDGVLASAHVILLAAGVVIFLGVAGEAFFKKTGIPDVAFLMIFGVIIGPVLGIIQPEAVIQVVPYFAALALIIIMFDGGLNLDIKHIVKTAHFSVTLAVLGFILSVVIITLAAHFALEWSWLESILLGSIVGGSSYQNFRRNEINVKF
jgi:cell volume regulation protein A